MRAMLLKKTAAALWLSGLLALSASPQVSNLPDPKQKAELQETAFRYFFTHELAGSKAEAFCISSAATLPLSFVQRFDANDPPVLWLSKCPIGPGKSEPLTMKKEPAVRISIGSIRWISSIEAEVRGSCRSGELGASTQLLHMVRKNGRWTVDRVTNELYS
jgi:hypothetical protein